MRLRFFWWIMRRMEVKMVISVHGGFQNQTSDGVQPNSGFLAQQTASFRSCLKKSSTETINHSSNPLLPQQKSIVAAATSTDATCSNNCRQT